MLLVNFDVEVDVGGFSVVGVAVDFDADVRVESFTVATHGVHSCLARKTKQPFPR